MSVYLQDPSKHEKWLAPHSLAWYEQLGRLTGQFAYPWRSTITEPSGETVFTEEVARMVAGKRVLDVGCGHGEYTVRWSETAREVYGLDVTDDFVRTGAELAGSNVTFVTGNTKDRLPFADDFFDGAYNRRGPMSAYADLGRVVRPGGEIVGVHPGDRLWQELAKWFPGLFPALAGSPTMDKLQGYLQRCDYAAEVEAVVSAEYLHEPEDVLRARCFGQVPEILEELKASSLDAVCAIFERHATDQGLPLTFERYLVRAKV